ncbi:MAG TPA: ABC transporter permease [Conexibacter sp.]|nr:ABC transporter permease [Conexibacter sp.]
MAESSPGFAALSWRQYRLERRMFWRNPSAAFFNFLLPLLFLVLLCAVLTKQSDRDVIVPGIAGMAVLATTFSALAYNMVFLREQGILKRMRGTPLPPGAYLLGIAGNAVMNTAVQIVLITLAGKAFYGIDWPRDVGELVLFVVLGVVCFASLGVALAHAIPTFEAATVYVNMIFLPVVFISIDAAHDPSFLKGIAEALPLAHLVEGLHDAMVSGRGIGDAWSALGVLAVWTVLGVVLAIRGFSWEQRRS